MDIPPPLYRRLPRQEQPPGESPWQSLNPPPFYLMYREYQSLFTTKFNTTLSSPSIRVNKMGWFTGFPVSVAKSNLGKQGDPCRRELKSMTGIYDWPIPRPLLWDEVKFIDRDSPGILVGSRKLST